MEVNENTCVSTETVNSSPNESAPPILMYSVSFVAI